jgi:tetratricopeptide (TPR) repeat protein
MRLGREIGDISNVGASMSGILAYIAFQEGDYAAGQAYCEAVLRLDHMVEDRPGIALVLGGLGSLIYLQGRYAQARPALEERLRIWRELHNLHGIAWSLNALGYLSLRQDDVRQAAAQFAESMALWRELNQPNTVVSCLAGMAEVAQSAGQADRAALLLSATLALFEARNARVEDVALDVLAGYPLITQADLERQAAGLRGALGEAAFAAAWAAGRAMSLEQAAAYALGEA